MSLMVRPLAMVASLLLAACQGGPATASATTPHIAVQATMPPRMTDPTPSPSATIRFTRETPQASSTEPNLEYVVLTLLLERLASTCGVAGIADLVWPDPAELDRRIIAELPDGTGWLEEGWLWAGPRDGLATAFGGEVAATSEREVWIILQGIRGDFAGIPFGQQVVRIATPGGREVWLAKDTTGALRPERCPPVDPPASSAPEPTPDVMNLDLGLTIEKFGFA